MVATHIFHKLGNSARLFMKKASWGSLFKCLIRLVILLVSQSKWLLCSGLFRDRGGGWAHVR